MAANPISWSDMAAWCHLTGRQLDSWDVMAIRAIDAAFLSDITPEPEPSKKPGAAAPGARKTHGR